MRRRVWLLALAPLLVSARGYAQSDRPTTSSFRIEWTPRPGWMRAGTDGYLYNESRWRVTNFGSGVLRLGAIAKRPTTNQTILTLSCLHP